jgi:cytochrome c-type biogenesis protein CcmH
MVVFWTVAAVMAVAVAALLMLALRRGDAEGALPEARDSDVYRDQLSEIDRDRARGTIPVEEAERLRAEVARRLIAAEGMGSTGHARGPIWPAAVMAAVIVGAGGFWGYLTLGAPGYPDLPLSARLAMAEDIRAARPAQAEAEAAAPARPPAEAPPEFVALMNELRTKVAERPDDLQGHRLLADNEARLGNFVAARVAQERVIALQAGEAPAADHILLARFMIAAAGGAVSPEAEAALTEGVRRDEADPDGLFFLGIARLQSGRPDLAFRVWRQYLQVAPADSPWQAEVRGRIGDLAMLAGVPFEVPPLPALAGPTAEDMAAAAAMSPEDRAEMVRGMVDRLGTRLATEGGTAEEWAQMIRALGMMGDADRAAAVWTEAQGVFEGRATDLETVRTAAREAGLTE